MSELLARFTEAQDFGIKLSRSNGQPMLAVSGDIDLVSAPQFLDALELLIDNHVGRLLIDLRDVTFIDSAGLGALLRARQLLVARGGGLEIAAASPWIHRLLRVTRLDQALNIR